MADQKQTLKDKTKILEDNGFDKAFFRAKYDECKTYYGKEIKRMELLDAIDKGKLWQALNAKFPPYQILPDTNFITKTKAGLVASIYTVSKCATVVPSSQEDREIIMNTNAMLDVLWSINKVGYYQFLAGERAALLNIGITQVGWKEELSGGSGAQPLSGDVALKNVNPKYFRRDPFAPDLDSSSYCFTYDFYHKSIFEMNPNYRDIFKTYAAGHQNYSLYPPSSMGQFTAMQSNKDYFALFTFWIREGSKVHEVHMIDLDTVLYCKLDIKPSMFPFAILYCNAPAGELIGSSECAKISANNIVYNLMDSIVCTAEYKNQRPPKFVNAMSGINLTTFMKHGSEADRTFVVNGDASKAVHYQEFPLISPNAENTIKRLGWNMGDVTGVDDRYTGRDTGSITTTGGMEDMLSRVTLLDTPKIMLYEEYTMQLTKLILHNYLEFSTKRKLLKKNRYTNRWEEVNVDLAKVKAQSIFNYQISISSDLPRNKQRLEMIADQLIEKQMQYGQEGLGNVELITPEEWLMFKDLGQMSEYMLERMGIQRLNNAVTDTAFIVNTYGQLTGQGVDPEEALVATAQAAQQMKQPQTGAGGQMPMMMPGEGAAPGMGMPEPGAFLG